MAGLEWLEPTCWQAQQARLKDAKRPKGQKANETFRDVLWRFYEIMRAGRIAMSIAPDPFVPPCVAELELRRPTRNSDEQGQPLDSAMIQYALILDDPSATSWPRDRLDSDFQISSLTYLTLLRRSLQHLWALERKHVEGYLLQRLNCPQTAVFWMCGSTQCLRSNICMQGATVSRPVRQSQSACRSTTQSPISNASEDPWVWCTSFLSKWWKHSTSRFLFACIFFPNFLPYVHYILWYVHGMAGGQAQAPSEVFRKADSLGFTFFDLYILIGFPA